ncbi:MAG: hypothetical protein IID59_07950 [Proteobacteria bacterium]|nr:hypothetical protein [Pseudomonadota bacterium]
MNLGPLWLSVKLAAITTLILLIVGTAIAWWLANTRSRAKPVVQSLVALPIVLPPTVMGFYLLVLLGPYGAIGSWWVELTGSALTFSFLGLALVACENFLDIPEPKKPFVPHLTLFGQVVDADTQEGINDATVSISPESDHAIHSP